MYWLNPRTWFRKPHEFITRNQEMFAEFDQSLKLHQYTFAVIDTELTGFNRKKDEIISIGAVRVVNLKIDLKDSFYQIIRPERTGHNKSTLVHQLSPTELEKAAPLAAVLPDFIDYLGKSLLVGHYLDLDMSFINRATWDVMGGALSNPGIETMRLVSGYTRNKSGFFNESPKAPKSYRLENLSKEYNLPHYLPHNSFEDAVQTACLFLYTIKKFRSGGLETLKDLYRAGRNLHI